MVTKVKSRKISKRKLNKELEEIAWEGLKRILQGRGTKRLMKKAKAIQEQLKSTN